MSTAFAERPQFFEGQYLGADDLQVLLDYCRDQIRRHLLGSHTWGVLAGIDIVYPPQPDGSTQAFLTPGVAVDGYGRAVVVAAPYPIDAGALAGQPAGEVTVWLRWRQTLGGGVRAGFEVCDASDAFERYVEGFSLEFGERPVVSGRESGVRVGDFAYTDAREAPGDWLPGQPLALDGAVPAQAFPGIDDLDRWLIPVGSVLWTGGALAAPTETSRKGSRLKRRLAGWVGESLSAADGLLRLQPRFTARAAGSSADQLAAAAQPALTDLVYCKDDTDKTAPRFREPIWLEADTRVRGQLRHYGTRTEWVDSGGTDYAAGGLVTALRRNAKSAVNGAELQVLLGAAAGNTGPTRLAVGSATPQAPADPCAPEFDCTVGCVIQSDGRVGIGAIDAALAVPLTIRASGANSDTLALQKKNGTLAWQFNLGATEGGLNVTQTDPTKTNLYIAANGNVGIGTTAPEAKLDVRALSSPNPSSLGMAKWLQLGNGSNPDEGRVWFQYGPALAPLLVMSDFANPPRVQFQQTGSGSETAPQFVSWIGQSVAGRDDLTLQAGCVGINTTAPKRALHVEGELHSGGSGAGYSFSDRNTGFVNAPTNGERWVWWASGGTARLSSGDDKLGITRDGRLGIGTVTPSTKLDVNGSIRLGSGNRYYAVGGLDDMRIIAGSVSDGTSGNGSGWSMVRTATGTYSITFNGAFAGTPVVVATPLNANNNDNVITVRGVTAAGFSVVIKDATDPSDEDKPENCSFNFIAYGPRS